MRPISHALPGALSELLRLTPLSDGKVGFAWTAAVGAAVDRATRVKLENGVLIVETTSAQWSRELHRSTDVILRRVQGLLGPEAVRSILVRAAN